MIECVTNWRLPPGSAQARHDRQEGQEQAADTNAAEGWTQRLHHARCRRGGRVGGAETSGFHDGRGPRGRGRRGGDEADGRGCDFGGASGRGKKGWQHL